VYYRPTCHSVSDVRFTVLVIIYFLFNSALVVSFLIIISFIPFHNFLVS